MANYSSETVRLTFQQLRDMSKQQEYGDNKQEKKMNSNKSAERPRKARPDLQIYRPGQSRLSKQKDAGTQPAQCDPELPKSPVNETDLKNRYSPDSNVSGSNSGSSIDANKGPFTDQNIDDIANRKTQTQLQKVNSKCSDKTKEEEKQRRREKKPDIQRYVPKFRQKNESANVNSQDSGFKVGENNGDGRLRAEKTKANSNEDEYGKRGAKDRGEERKVNMPEPLKKGQQKSIDFIEEDELEWDHQADLELDRGSRLTPESSDDQAKDRYSVSESQKLPAAKTRFSRKTTKGYPRQSDDQDSSKTFDCQAVREEPHCDRQSDTQLTPDNGENELVHFSGLVITNSRFDSDVEDNHAHYSDMRRSREESQEPRYSPTSQNTDKKLFDPSSPKPKVATHKASQDEVDHDNQKRKQRRPTTRGSRQSEKHDTDSTCVSRSEIVAPSTDQKSKKLTFSDDIPSPCTKISGIIRLPSGTTTTAVETRASAGPSHHRQHAPLMAPPVPFQASSGHRGRGGHRTLWDPNNPTKPSNVSSSSPNNNNLYFHDPSEPQVTEDRTGQQPHRPGFEYPQFNYNQYNMQPNFVSENYAQYPYGTTSGAGYVDGHGYYRGYDQGVICAPMMQTAPNSTGSLWETIRYIKFQLAQMFKQGLNTEIIVHGVFPLKKELELKVEQLILLDIEFSSVNGACDLLWRMAFYHVIEAFRSQITEFERHYKAMPDLDTPEKIEYDRSKKLHSKTLDEGSNFFESLLQKLQVTYKFSLDKYLESFWPATGRTQTIAIICCQRITLCLGDLARYKEVQKDTKNFAKARYWYMKAQQIYPKNGKPYNQLAILGLHTRHKFESVYFYIRSLAACNPMPSARECLTTLFNEAYQRGELNERNSQMEKAKKRRMKANRRPSERGHRLEIWVAHDGTSLQDPINDDNVDSDDLAGFAMSEVISFSREALSELNKRFIFGFLNVHGKLFTKIGMETFPEEAGRMLFKFRALLAHTPIYIGPAILLQLITINMFTIENLKPTDKMEENCRSALQEQAVELGLEMFGLMIDRLCYLLRQDLFLTVDERLDPERRKSMIDDIHMLMPCVKAWSDWMSCHISLWNPPPLPFDPLLGPNVNVWKSMVDLFNVLSEVRKNSINIYEKIDEGRMLIFLPEDASLAGFVPLLAITHLPAYVSSNVEKKMAEHFVRVTKLCTFAEIVYGLEPPLMSYDVETRQYVSIMSSMSTSQTFVRKRQVSSDVETNKDADDDVIIEDEIIESEESGSHASYEGHIQDLKARKEELTRQVAEQARKQESIQAAINNSHQENRPIELEIHPIFLVPDTNCFIDHLYGIRQLLASKKYTILIPLIVVEELEYLSKTVKEGYYESMEQAEMVRSIAEDSVEFLKKKFESRNPHLRAITSKGNILDTIAYRCEESEGEGNNDDLILRCCLCQCRDKAKDFMPKSPDEPIHLYREVVLLTNDRNLRLKAHVNNVPVKDIPSFLSWANIS